MKVCCKKTLEALDCETAFLELTFFSISFSREDIRLIACLLLVLPEQQGSSDVTDLVGFKIDLNLEQIQSYILSQCKPKTAG
jgi:hypothetical protein